jgi:hypothetical protein
LFMKMQPWQWNESIVQRHIHRQPSYFNMQWFLQRGILSRTIKCTTEVQKE